MPYATDPQPDTVITVHRAGPIHDQHVPVLRITAVAEMPEVGRRSPLETREIFKADGLALADALAQHLPGGTLNELVIRLLDLMKSSLIVPVDDGSVPR